MEETIKDLQLKEESAFTTDDYQRAAKIRKELMRRKKRDSFYNW